MLEWEDVCEARPRSAVARAGRRSWRRMMARPVGCSCACWDGQKVRIARDGEGKSGGGGGGEMRTIRRGERRGDGKVAKRGARLLCEQKSRRWNLERWRSKVEDGVGRSDRKGMTLGLLRFHGARAARQGCEMRVGARAR